MTIENETVIWSEYVKGVREKLGRCEDCGCLPDTPVIVPAGGLSAGGLSAGVICAECMEKRKLRNPQADKRIIRNPQAES